MDLVDDDFGDLYADVEFQASSAINGVPDIEAELGFTVTKKTRAVPNSKSSSGEKFDSHLKKFNSVADDESTRSGNDGPSLKASSLEADGSDSEDDLNIVLNDEDCKMFPVTSCAGATNGCVDDDEDGDFDVVTEGNGSGKMRGDQLADGLEQNCNGHGGERGNGVKSAYNSQYKYIRTHGYTFPSNIRVNGSAGVLSSSVPARGNWEDNGCNQHKGLNSCQVANIRRYGFSLPWYRTILDVNISTFEEKPWRFPGVDLTDFFNFGFDEDSWKQYCNSMEQYRQQTSMQTRIPVFEPAKLNRAYVVGSEHEKEGHDARDEDITQVEPLPKFVDGGKKQLELPKGRAIQVEGSIGERQPSVDVRRPRIRDSDVVIQIAVQDSTQDASDSGKDELGYIDSSVHEASTNGDLDVDDSGDILCSGSDSGDELSAESLEENIRNLDMSALRCSQLTTQMHVDSDNQHQVNICTSEGIAEAKETGNKEKEGVGRIRCKSDICTIETKYLLGDQSQFSPTPFRSISNSEASKDGVYLKKPSINSGTELQESVTSNYKNAKRNDIKTKSGDSKNLSRHKSLSRAGQKHHGVRLGNVSEKKSYPENDDQASPMLDAECKSKIYSRRKGPIQEKLERHSRRLRDVSEQGIHPENDVCSPTLDTEGLSDRNHLSVDYSRKKERLHDFGYDREEFSYYRETGSSRRYGGERFDDNHVRTVFKTHSRGKGHHSFGDEMDPCVQKNWDGREYFHERSARVDIEDDRDRDWNSGRGLSTADMSPLTYEESRKLVSKHSSTSKERDTRWRRKSNELQFRKRTDHDGHLLNYKHEDGSLQEKYGRSLSFTDRESDSIEMHLPFNGREVKISGRRGTYSDRSRSMEIEAEYRRGTDHRSLFSQSSRESYAANGGGWHDTISMRDDVYDSRLTERYARHRREMCDEEGRDNWFGCYLDTEDTQDDIIYYDDHVDLGRRRHRYRWRSKMLHWMDDELFVRHQDDDLYAEDASFSYPKYSTHERSAKYASAHDGMLIDDMQSERHRYKMTRERRRVNCISKSSDTIDRHDHEQTVPRCKDSVDLIIGEGKSSGRCLNGRSLTHNGRLENVELKFAKEQTTLKGFKESHMGKAVQTDFPNFESSKTNEKRLDKFQVTEHNEDLDIEEGQITTEEPNMVDHLEKKHVKVHVSESEASVCNVKKRMLHGEIASNGSKVASHGNKVASHGNKVVEKYDKQRILETLAKMEKRRERFKDPITLKKEPDKTPEPQVDLIVDTTETKQQRPARKRRWGGS